MPTDGFPVDDAVLIPDTNINEVLRSPMISIDLSPNNNQDVKKRKTVPGELDIGIVTLPKYNDNLVDVPEETNGTEEKKIKNITPNLVTSEQEPSTKSSTAKRQRVDEDLIHDPLDLFTYKPRRNEDVLESKSFISVRASRFPIRKPMGYPGIIELRLPEKFITLISIFDALEMTIMFMKGRRMRCDFHRLQTPVESSSRRKLDMRHLGQIKAIYPEAYTYEAVMITHKCERIPTIILDINLQAQHKESVVSESPKPTKQFQTNVDSPKTMQNAINVSFSTTRRKAEFKKRIIDFVITFHDLFLQEKGISTMGRTIKQWHSDFPLESVPDIEPAPLPEFTSQTPNKKDFDPFKSTGKSRNLTDIAISLQNQNERSSDSNTTILVSEQELVNNLETGGSEKLKANKESTNTKLKTEEADIEKNSSKIVDIDAKPKTTEQLMLERIREKQRLKKEATLGLLGKGPITDKVKESMKEKLPQLARKISMFFSSQRKTVLPLSIVTRQMIESWANPISKDDMNTHLELLNELVPEWITLKTHVLIIDGNYPMQNVLEKLMKK
ncbi:hypothetical protein HK096_001569 [Nowakowskiella sp. JEL0078]|nr:hypothetical protein HK096_001569 [Nowakowskiella sp. JEL0078]